MLTTILPYIIIAATAAVAITATIMYITTAKRNVPLSKKEADILWKLHKQKTNCSCNKMHHLTRNHGEIITGFKCQCGFRYTQKSPLLSRKLDPTSITHSHATTRSLHR